MDRLKIKGGRPLQGTVRISGAKNAALPILVSSLLTEERCVFERIPGLQDISTTLKVLGHLGVQVTAEEPHDRVSLQAKRVSEQEAPYDLVRKMRASVLVLGPLLSRFGKAKVSLPGGCAIGARPINYHLDGLRKMGAQIELENGYVLAESKRLKGTRIQLDFASVGATENLMMAAALAKGETEIRNAAREPEISDLAEVLRKMGAEVSGDGTDAVLIQGQDRLSGCQHQIIGDRIEAGTFLAAAFATQGDVTVDGIEPVYLAAVLHELEKAGAILERNGTQIRLRCSGVPKACDIKTAPYPGFPTDMQAQFMALMTIADGTSVIEESVFENRFMHVSELARLGADIRIKGNAAIVTGKPKLVGAPLMATDLRASASLVIGGLAAEGETEVNRIYHLDRGYEKMEEKLRSLGADIFRSQ